MSFCLPPSQATPLQRKPLVAMCFVLLNCYLSTAPATARKGRQVPGGNWLCKHSHTRTPPATQVRAAHAAQRAWSSHK